MASGTIKEPSLSVVIPAYNERRGIEGAVNETLATLRREAIPFEVIIVDDGSSDGTARVIEKNYLGKPSIKVHLKEENEGFGSALRKGIELASMDYLTYVPVDNPLTPDVLRAFLSRLGQADVLVGCRSRRIGYSMRMKLNSWIYERVISVFFGLRLQDYNWIHLYPTNLFKRDRLDFRSNGVFTPAEILILCHRKGLSFCQFPVEMRGRDYGVKTAATWKAARRAAREFLAFCWREILRPRIAGGLGWRGG